MVKIDINELEIKALDKILLKVKTDIQTGFYLSNLRIKLQQAINKEKSNIAKQRAKAILGIKDEEKDDIGRCDKRSKKSS